MKKQVLFAAVAAGLLAVSAPARADSCDSPWRDYWRSRPRHQRTVVISREPRWSYSWGSRSGWARDCYPRDERTVVIYREPPSEPSTPTYASSRHAGTVVINIQNSNGSYTPVTLRRSGSVYVGPRGEQYLSLPTEEQLKEVYGLK